MACAPAQSFKDANTFHRAMRRLASTKVGRVVFRPTANRLDRIVGAHATARLATPAEREQLWREGVDIYPGLAREQWVGERRTAMFARGLPPANRAH